MKNSIEFKIEFLENLKKTNLNKKDKSSILKCFEDLENQEKIFIIRERFKQNKNNEQKI